VSKKVELIEVDAAAEVKVEALLRAKEVELISFESLTYKAFNFVYFVETGERLCVKFVV
jgi:hypothetical protein